MKNERFSNKKKDFNKTVYSMVKLICFCIFFLSFFLTQKCTLAKAEKNSINSSNLKLWPESYLKICGPYSVTALLRYFENPITFEEVCKNIGFDPSRGTSLLNMQNYLEDCKLYTLFIKTTPQECFKLGTPMIVCLRNPEGGEAPYHFISLVPDPYHEGNYLKFSGGKKANSITIEDLIVSSWWVGEILLVSNKPFKYKLNLRTATSYAGQGIGTAIICIGIVTGIYNCRNHKNKKK